MNHRWDLFMAILEMMERLEEPSVSQFICNEHSLPKAEDASVSECALSRTAVHGSLVLLFYHKKE